jgi:hypothetical protein
MPPVDLRIREFPVGSSRSNRRRIHKKNQRSRAQLLLDSSVPDPAAAAELADRERQRDASARAHADLLAHVDRERARAGCPASIKLSPGAADGLDVLALAQQTLHFSREQAARDRDVVSRIAESRGRRPWTQADITEPIAARAAGAPPPATSVNSPTAAAGGPAVPNAQLEREAAELRSAVASLEAERAEHLLRLQLLGELARRAPPTEPITVGQAADSPPADVLAAKDAEIAALRFRLREQGSRRLDSRLRLAAAFVFNPENQLDARPPPEQCASRSPPWTPAHSPPPAAASPPASPVPMARPLPSFEWGQGLARTEPGPVVAGPPACPRPVETHSPVTVSAPPPWARSNP